MKLSIIIPFFNVEPYFNELLDSLMPQINNKVEEKNDNYLVSLNSQNIFAVFGKSDRPNPS